jgi:S-formylglutathione hydrolase
MQSSHRLALTALALVALVRSVAGQGVLVADSVSSPGLAANLLGDRSVRPVAVYLPPSYSRQRTQRYPVLYMLHGATSKPEEWLDGKTYQGLDLKATLDSLISAGTIPELIVVMPNSDNRFGADWYANSPALGNWEDFIAQDVIRHVDKTYRTEARRDRRALYGHSMGGFGALAISFRHTDLFGFVYVASPALVALTGPIGPAGQAWPALSAITRWQDAPEQIHVVLGFAAALDGSRTSPRLFDSLPYGAGPDGKPLTRPAVEARWRAKMPPDLASEMVRRGAKAPVILIEAGSEEKVFLEEIAVLRGRLDSLHVAYADTVFDGGHTDKVRDRLTNHMLPALARWLGGTRRANPKHSVD